MDHQGSPCYCSLKWLSESYDSKVNSVGQLDGKKLAASVLVYVFNLGFPPSLFIYILFYKVEELVDGGSVFNGAYPVLFF